MTFCSFHSIESSVICYSTRAPQKSVKRTRVKNPKNYVLLLCDAIRDLYARRRTNEIGSINTYSETMRNVIRKLNAIQKHESSV